MLAGRHMTVLCGVKVVQKFASNASAMNSARQVIKLDSKLTVRPTYFHLRGERQYLRDA